MVIIGDNSRAAATRERNALQLRYFKGTPIQSLGPISSQYYSENHPAPFNNPSFNSLLWVQNASDWLQSAMQRLDECETSKDVPLNKYADQPGSIEKHV